MTDLLNLQVTDVVAEARDILLLELRRASGDPLPAFEPGAHIEIRLPNGLQRHYSLLNDWRETERYVIAVGKARNGRGGSAYVHGSIQRGTPLTVGAPRNHFRLDPGAASYRFIAGGIGITPIMAMIRWCNANQRPWQLFYASRSRQRAAFYEELREFGSGKVRFHFDDECGEVLNASDALRQLREGEQIYCCGPEPLMRAVEEEASGLPDGVAHFEWFAAPQDGPAASPQGQSFQVELRRSGVSLEVPPERSILEVLEASGFEVPFACREGLCRTCETTVCEGEPDHRDYVLSQEERCHGKSMMVCVSRSKSPVLVLDM